MQLLVVDDCWFTIVDPVLVDILVEEEGEFVVNVDDGELHGELLGQV